MKVICLVVVFLISFCEASVRPVIGEFYARYQYNRGIDDFGNIDVGCNGSNIAYVAVFKGNSTVPSMVNRIDISKNGWRQEVFLEGKLIVSNVYVEEYENRIFDIALLKTVADSYHSSKQRIDDPSGFVPMVSLKYENEKVVAQVGVIASTEIYPVYSWISTENVDRKKNEASYSVNNQNSLLEKVIVDEQAVIKLLSGSVGKGRYMEPDFPVSVETITLDERRIESIVRKVAMSRELLRLKKLKDNSVNDWIASDDQYLKEILFKAGEEFYHKNRHGKYISSIRQRAKDKLRDENDIVADALEKAQLELNRQFITKYDNNRQNQLSVVLKSCAPHMLEGLCAAFFDDLKSELMQE